ncbi:hypothetical protein AVEN_94767-1 [Araneus ventricosus]|uniref:Uncharacterized protein n=1 Tax=Araneus ventricosus TaxID=182803 RepID=A0A4Y2CP14_ARAVE|nr:hypothetical protein AVEN_94767-1 [Araneus ventricosus]
MLCFGKFVRMSDDIHHWFTSCNNISIVHGLGFIVSIQNSNGEGVLFKSSRVAATRKTFWDTWVGKSVTAYLNYPETSRIPCIRHYDLARIIVLSLANAELAFKCSAPTDN